MGRRVRSLENKLDSILRRQVGNGPGNAVVALQSVDRSFLYQGAAGRIDADNGAPMAPDSPYFMASVSKMFTAAAVMRLVDQGRLDLESPIARILPLSIISGIQVFKGVDRSDDIRVVQLLNQTSGLPDFEMDSAPGERSLFAELAAGKDVYVDLEEALRITRRIPAPFPPGAAGKAHYSNLNYRLLGRIIEAVTGESLAESFSREIFAPLGLQRTCFFDFRAQRSNQRPATVYYRKGRAQIDQYLSSNNADGGLVSTAPECLRFLRAFFEGELFKKERLPQMMDWKRLFFPIQYGCGMMRFRLPRYFWFQQLPEFIGHSGSTGSFAFFCPSRSLYLAGTLNQVSPARPFFFMISLVRALGR